MSSNLHQRFESARCMASASLQGNHRHTVVARFAPTVPRIDPAEMRFRLCTVHEPHGPAAAASASLPRIHSQTCLRRAMASPSRVAFSPRSSTPLAAVRCEVATLRWSFEAQVLSLRLQTSRVLVRSDARLSFQGVQPPRSKVLITGIPPPTSR